MSNWQNIIVGLMIACALLYVGRRGFKRLRSFYAARSGDNACETGCGKCETSQTASSQPLKTFIQIERSPASSRRAR